VSRTTLAFVPGTVSLGTARTGSDGSYSFPLAAESSPHLQLRATYAGADTLWPAFANWPLDSSPSITSTGVVNAANFRVEPLPPGTWFSIFGQSLGRAGQWTNPNTVTLGGARVSVSGSPAVISYNSGPLSTNGVTA